ncbi:hypothetical protein HUU62_26545 [Rhodoferax sp. 4810]|uniref:Uncharacterized protein n=1 Tax=Thiospirillum jenense TaxID=1653858 RepID=A0A839HEK8_9GAMM|nr:hypothetical protein [Thiospirillum jenense]MBB1077961.1 hypothetical protein [Rhodoferax jenense]MBB1127385.1 hypothetical protein [Thiospirillum jenense]
MTKPNLFSYATSELSQDAFICWLLSWITPEIREYDKNIHELFVNLLKAFLKNMTESFHPKLKK